MLLTEEQARGNGKTMPGKMCAQSAASPKPFSCRASGCAAWRWFPWDRDCMGDFEGGHTPVGYCGLAGSVEDITPHRARRKPTGPIKPFRESSESDDVPI